MPGSSEMLWYHSLNEQSIIVCWKYEHFWLTIRPCLWKNVKLNCLGHNFTRAESVYCPNIIIYGRDSAGFWCSQIKCFGKRYNSHICTVNIVSYFRILMFPNWKKYWLSGLFCSWNFKYTDLHNEDLSFFFFIKLHTFDIKSLLTCVAMLLVSDHLFFFYIKLRNFDIESLRINATGFWPFIFLLISNCTPLILNLFFHVL